MVDHFEARRDAQRQGVPDEVLLRLDLMYGVRIDVAYSELKIAESLEILGMTVKRKSAARGAIN